MKNIYTRFLAIVAVIVMALGCTVVAFAEEDPYKDFFDSVSSSCIILAESALMLEPSSESEQIGTLEIGTACKVKGKYFSNIDLCVYYIVDLDGLNINGHEAGYGFIKSDGAILRPKWLMLPRLTPMESTPWGTETKNGLASGLIMVIDESETCYAVYTMDNLNGTSKGTSFILKFLVKDYSSIDQDLFVAPMSTPVYDDSKKEKVGEIPGFTIVDVKEENVDFIYVTVNPGTDDEFSGWIPWQPLQAILN